LFLFYGDNVNLLHLKYAVEVEKTKSITKAAENLFMGQPNLSRAIKELEETLGIVIFNRTSKGIIPSEQGKEFLNYAKNILQQVDEMESLYNTPQAENQVFSISIPRASYITHAFSKVVASLELSKGIEFNFDETNNMQVINNMIQSNYNLGIIRYQVDNEKYFENLLKKKNIQSKIIWEFEFNLLMSAEHPLATKSNLTYEDVSNYIEIAHGDNNIPSLPLSDVTKMHLTDACEKRVFVYERGSQFDLLCDVPTTYMWVSPIPSELVRRHSLVQRKCREARLKYKDVLIWKNGYRFSDLDKKFIMELEKSKVEVSKTQLH